MPKAIGKLTTQHSELSTRATCRTKIETILSIELTISIVWIEIYDEDNLRRPLYKFELAAEKCMSISIKKARSLVIARESRRKYNKSADQVVTFKHVEHIHQSWCPYTLVNLTIYFAELDCT